MKRIIYFFVISLLAISCSQNNKQQAFDEIERVKLLIESQDFGTAKDILDTLKANYKEEVDVRRAILELSQKIEYAEAERNMNYTDSILPLLQEQLETILPQFTYKKNSEYEDTGYYIDKYNPSLDTHNQFIKATVNEHGDIALVSGIVGGAIKHTQVKVSDKEGNYAETEVVADEGMNYSFKDVKGRTYQTVTFAKGKDNGVLMFIYNYSDNNLFLERLGGKNTAPVTISGAEKQSIRRLMELSLLLKEIEHTQKEYTKAKTRIEYFRTKTNN
ncbi:DUF2167 domain-containing protein [Bacteroidales bacterium OttesenSCG-928-M11]|nr:DUF2167 domain-containing protein [Bacteroidales bacterium OttesenSCG-928-M11]